MSTLDTYLATLADGEMQKTASRETFREASFEDLAKAAGIKMAADCCAKCGSRMVKTGSIYQCTCGMMKKAGTKCGACGMEKTESEDGVKCGCGVKVGSKMSLERREGLSTKQFAVPKAKAKKIGVAGEIKGEAKGKYPIPDKAHARNALARVSAFGSSTEKSLVRSKVHSKYPDIGKDKESAVKLTAFFAAHNGDLEKMAAASGMDKEAIVGLLAKYAPNLLAAGKSAVKGISSAAKGRNVLGLGKGLSKGQLAAQKGVATKSFGAAKQSLMASKPAQMVQQALASKPGQAVAGAAGKAVNWAKANPLKATAAGTGAGILAGKTVLSSAEIIEVGDRAGRIMARIKTAQSIPVDELKESIEEAQSREDIPGRAKRWQIGGGVGGGLAGGALAGIPTFLATRNPLLAGGAALAGTAGGAALGQHFGKAHGAEEAAADKAISLLRALRAHRAGQESGYGAGLQRGYAYGRGFGGEEGATE